MLFWQFFQKVVIKIPRSVYLSDFIDILLSVVYYIDAGKNNFI